MKHLLTLIFSLTIGCATPHKHYTTPNKLTLNPKNCKLLGKHTSYNAVVMIHKGCLTTNTTTITIVTTSNNYLLAAKESTSMIEDILGYKPILGIISMMKVKISNKTQQLMIFLVGGRAPPRLF